MGLFGGDSSSSTTNFYEKNTPTMTGDGSAMTANIIRASEGATVTVTDNGAVAQAIDFAKSASAQIASSSQSMYEGALATVRDSSKQLAQAYQQGQAGDQTQLKYAGFAVVGLAVAAAAFIALKAK